MKALTGQAPLLSRFTTMARLAVSMVLHNRLKSVGTLIGVVFAVVLSNQQAGTFLGLLKKNTMFVDYTDADLWIAPPGTRQLAASKPISKKALYAARAMPGVAWAEPLIYTGAAISLPNGGQEAVTLVGTAGPRFAGGPWNVVVGDKTALLEPDTMFFEDADREKFGGLNRDDTRELLGHNVRAGGFTWGLLPFGPSFAFAEYDLAERMTHLDNDQTHYVLVGVAPGTDPQIVKSQLQKLLPDFTVMTKAEFSGSIVKYILTATAIGISFGTSTIFALIVGFVIVSLSMFSAVVDNVREFGTLKAIGARTNDLAMLLLVQSVIFALSGALIGLALVSRMGAAIRSPNLAMQLPGWLYLSTTVLMVVLCISASVLALVRVRNVEPGMVFR